MPFGGFGLPFGFPPIGFGAGPFGFGVPFVAPGFPLGFFPAAPPFGFCFPPIGSI